MWQLLWQRSTLSKFIITPEKLPSEKESSLPTTIFLGPGAMLNSGGVSFKRHTKVKLGTFGENDGS